MNTLQRVRMITLPRARSFGWRLAVLVAAMASCTPYALAASGSWNVNGNGSWNTAGNWTPNTAVPGTAPGDVVGLVNNITTNATVTINTNVTLGTLSIGDTNASNTFTLATTTGGTLTFNNGGSGASLVQTATSAGDTISAGFTLADNITVTASTTLVSRALTISGNIIETGGARNLTKAGSGAVVLSGANNYTGTTTITAGILQFVNTASLYNGGTSNWTASKITAGSGGTLAVSVGASNFTSGNVTTLLTNLGGLGGSVNNNGLLAGSSIGFDTSNAGGSFTIADAIKNSTGTGGGAIGLVKLGSGTLSLTGLSTTAANNYTGTTVIDQATLVLPDSQTTRFTGGLQFGASAGSTNVGSVDLSNGSAEFNSQLYADTSSASANTITIGSGRTLAVNGNVAIGAGSDNARLTLTGAGAWNVTASGGTFRIGRGGSGAGSGSTVDASGLATLNVDLRSTGSTGGTIRLGSDGGTGGGGNTAMLITATTSTLKANQLYVQDTNNGRTAKLRLGAGSQTLNVNDIRFGSTTRGFGNLDFVDSTLGSLTVRSADGTGRAALYVGMSTGQTIGGGGTVDLTGHYADLLFSTVALSRDAANNAFGTSGSYVSTMSFDYGVFDATSVLIATQPYSRPGSWTGTLNIGGTNNWVNTFAINSLDMANTIGSSGTASATVNIAGNQTSGTITNATLATAGATTGTAAGTLNISGGSTRFSNGITLVSRNATPGTASATIIITGGSVSMGGNVATTGSGGTTASTVTLDGGSLNMNGFALGGTGQLIDVFNLRSGTLSNLGQFNAGANLVKTSTGTLTLTGTSTYMGATGVQEGVVRFNSVAASTGAQALGSGATVNLGVAGTSTGEIDYFGGGGTLDKNVFALGNGRNRIRNSGGGVLTLSGTLTKNGTILELASGTFSVTGQITGSSASSDLYVNGATVTLTNTNNDYNGPTYVYGGGTLALGTNSVVPNGSALLLGATGTDSGSGTLNLGVYSDTVAGLSFGAGGGTLKMAASQTASAQLATNSSLTLGAGTVLDLTGMGTSAGLYRLVSGTSLSGSFGTVTGLDSKYVLRYGTVNANSIDAQRKADQSSTFTMTTGTVTRALVNATVAISGSVTNSTPADGSNLAVSLSTGSGLTVGNFGSGTTSIAPQARTSVAGMIQTGTSTGTQNWSVINTDNSAITTVSTATGSLQIVNQRSFSVSNSGTINLGNFLRTAAVTGSATISSSGLYATTASATLGTFSGTSTGGFSLGLASGTNLFSGDEALQQSIYTLSGSAASAGAISDSFTSTVSAELGSISPVSVSLVGTAYDPAMAILSGGITSGTSWFVNLGEHNQGTGSFTQGFTISNLLQTLGYTADLDLLSFASDPLNTGAIGITLTGTSFGTLTPGDTNSYQASLSLGTAGGFTNVYNLSFGSSKDGSSLGGSSQNVQLTVTGVIIVPEPGAVTLAGIGVAASLWRLRRRARHTGRGTNDDVA